MEAATAVLFALARGCLEHAAAVELARTAIRMNVGGKAALMVLDEVPTWRAAIVDVAEAVLDADQDRRSASA